MSNIEKIERPQGSTRLLIIGRAWFNHDANEDNRKPVIRARVDRRLGANVTLGPNDIITFFPNKKRDGEEGKLDADLNFSIEVPIKVAGKFLNNKS